MLEFKKPESEGRGGAFCSVGLNGQFPIQGTIQGQQYIAGHFQVEKTGVAEQTRELLFM